MRASGFYGSRTCPPRSVFLPNPIQTLSRDDRTVRRVRKTFQKIVLLLVAIVLVCFEQWTTLDEWIAHSYASVSVPVFGFHNVTTGDPESYLDYSAADLRVFLEDLARNDYYFLDSVEFYEYFVSRDRNIQELDGKRPVMLSFDDGNVASTRNFIDVARSIEAKYGIFPKATLFVNTQHFDDREPKNKLRCADFQDSWRGEVIDVQSHGHRHQDLTQLGDRELREDLQQSQSAIVACAQPETPKTSKTSNDDATRRVLSLAYPYNAWDDRVETATREVYDAAYTYSNSVFRWGWNENAYEIPRVRVYARQRPETLIEIARLSAPVSENRRYHRFQHRGARLFMRWL